MKKIGGVKMATYKGLWVHVTPLSKPKFAIHECPYFNCRPTIDTSRAHLLRSGKLKKKIFFEFPASW